MVRSVTLGAFTLTVLYALVQNNAGSSLNTASGVLVSALRRFMSAGVAGIPNRATPQGPWIGRTVPSKPQSYQPPTPPLGPVITM